MSERTPPRWLESIAQWALPRGHFGQGALGDLAEGFETRARRSVTRASGWYAVQVSSLVVYRVWRGRGGVSTSSDSDVLMDLHWSVRALVRHPGFAIGVVGVLGLGLGANVAVFSVVDGTLENTSWWGDADRAVAVWPDNQFSLGQLEMYSEQQTAYETLGGYVELAFALRTPDGDSESVNGVMMTPALFRELAAQPTVGRGLADEDGLFGAEPVAVMSQGLWRRAFGGDPSIVGSRVEVGGRPVTVVGIQAAGGSAPGGRTELWLPVVPDPREDDYWKAQSYTVVGTLRPGASLEDAHEDLMGFTRTLSGLFPMFFPEGFADGLANVTRADASQRRLVATPLLLLLGGTALLMLVTALNVGNLLLGRAIDRRRELAVRAALGASKGRVVRQLLMEGLVLTGLAMALGTALASSGGAWIADLFVEQSVVVSSSVVAPRVLLFSLLMGGVAWFVLNGVPVTHFIRASRGGMRLNPDSGAAVQRGLVAVQAALATLLLVAAALFVSTVDNLRKVPLGFDPADLVAIELSTPEDRVASPVVAREFYDRLTERVRNEPGVLSVGLTGWLPLREQAPPTPINLRDAPVDPREAIRAPMQMVDPGFFEALGVEPLEGRFLGSEDRDSERPTAVVVNETLARTLWSEGSALGRMIAIDPHAWDSWAPVVGVVPDIRSGEIGERVGPALYVALAESPSRDVTLVVRSADAGAALLVGLRRAVREVDPLVPIRSVSYMEDVVRSAFATAWVMMGLLLLLAGLATGLGAVGIYAVLAQHVALSRKEIGVRMALGAQPGVVVGKIVRSGLLLAGSGIAVGCLAAAASSRLLESLLFEVSGVAPRAYLSAGGALLLAAVLAAWIPARRAGRLPPAGLLRGE